MSDPQMAMAIIAGHKFTPAEFELGMEIVKATLLAISGGFIAYSYNLRAKQREQDGALFNEFIKEKVKSIHDINKFITGFVNGYLQVVDLQNASLLSSQSDVLGHLEQTPKLSYLAAKSRELNAQAKQQEMVLEFVKKQLPDLAQNIVQKSAANRYTIGEENHMNLANRVANIQTMIEDIWEHFYLVGLAEANKISKNLSDDNNMATDELIKAMYSQHRIAWRNHAEVSKKWLFDDLNDIQISFDEIARSKGLGNSRPNILIEMKNFFFKSQPAIQKPFLDWFDQSQITTTEGKIRKWRAEKLRARVD